MKAEINSEWNDKDIKPIGYGFKKVFVFEDDLKSYSFSTPSYHHLWLSNFEESNFEEMQSDDDPYIEPSKTITFLPSLEKKDITHAELFPLCRNSLCYFSITQFVAWFYGFEYFHETEALYKSNKPYQVAFFDIETVDDNFVFGAVNDKVFTDIREFWQELIKYKVIVGHNIYRYDFGVLARGLGKDAIWREYMVDKMNFQCPINQIAIDTFQLVKLNKGKFPEMGLDAIVKSLGFNEEISTIKKDLTTEQLAEKCKQDIRKTRFLCEKANLLKVFDTFQIMCNEDSVVWQNCWQDGFHKAIFFNYYLKKNLIPIKLPNRTQMTNIGGLKELKKPGFYKNIWDYDIESAYPTAAVLNNKSFFDCNEDTIFQDVFRDFIAYAKDPELKSFMKFNANAIVGEQATEKIYFRRVDLRHNIINRVNNIVRQMLSEDDCIGVNTDCGFFKNEKEFEKDSKDDFNIRLKNKFKWIYFYSIDKSISKNQDNSIDLRQFRTLRRNPSILTEARDEIIEKLSAVETKEQLLKYLKTPKTLVNKTLNRLKSTDVEQIAESLKYVEYKKSAECSNVDATSIWDSLPLGFNELYLKDAGVLTPNKEKANLGAYKTLILEYAEEFQV